MVVSSTLPFLAQNQSCPNVDLAQGNFNNWTGNYGSYSFPSLSNGFANTRHTIITNQGIDPHTCGGLQMIPPGHTKSIRLGNSNNGAEAEKISYTVNVTPSSNLFVYKYAVVLEDPQHPATQQPKFEAKILNSSGMLIGGGCGVYTVFSGQSGQNFQSCGGVKWLPWTVVGIDLSAYVGQTIEIEFTTWDCLQGGHFGYAYLAAECLPLSIDVNLCSGSQTLTLTAPPGFQSYSWQPGNLNGQQVTIQNPTLNQTYTCTMSTFSNQGTCSVDLTVQAIPTYFQSGFINSGQCDNEIVQFQSSTTASQNGQNQSIQQYTWDFGNGTVIQGNNPNPTTIYNQPGTYSVTLISESTSGCLDTLTQNINILATPHILTQVNQNCISQQTSFFLPNYFGVDSVSWDFGDGSINEIDLNPVHTYATAGQYPITTIAYGTNGCNDTVSIPVQIHPLPPIDAGPNLNICPFDSISLNAVGGISYQWENPYFQNQTCYPSNSGWVSVQGTDSLGCLASDSLYINIFTIIPIVAMDDSQVCDGDSIQISAQFDGQINWGNGIVNQQFTTPVLGSNSFIVQGIDNNGCISTDTLQILVNQLPNVFAGNDTMVCPGSMYPLNAQGALNYSWSNSVNNASSIEISSNTFLNVIGTNSLGCSNQDSLQIFIDPIPNLSFNLSETIGCIPLQTQIDNTSTGNTFSTIEWILGDGNQLFGNNIQHTYTEVGCFDISMNVETTLGCLYSYTQPQIICTHPLPIADFSPNSTNLTTVYNGCTFSNSSTGATVYSWDFGDGTPGTNIENPFHSFPTTSNTNYLVSLIATNEFACSDTAWLSIEISEELTYYIPNAFTPDGNFNNNIWKPVFSEGLNPQDYHVIIFDRWGEIIWESYNSEVGWDGTYGMNGIPVQDGTYIYNIIFGNLENDLKERVTGHIVLIK